MLETVYVKAIGQFGGLQGPEILILIFAAMLLLFGSKKLPELARGIGRASGEFKRGKEEITRELNEITKEPAPQPRSSQPPQAAQQNTSAPTMPSSKPKYNTQPKTDEEKKEILIKAAKEIGIDTENKTEDEIRIELSKKVSGGDGKPKSVEPKEAEKSN